VREILFEIERMRAEEIAPEELATAKDSIARSLPGMFETTPQAAATAGQLFVHDLSLDYYRNLPGHIDNLTAAEVQRVAREHLHPEHMLVVAVGDKSLIRDMLEKLQLGPVECVDVNGDPIQSLNQAMRL
jgi:zinc protease